jgi:predicted Zn-dependent protease with MMP-like domain
MGVTEPPAGRFERLAAEALDGLPDWVQERLDNVDVLIEDRPPPDQPGLLGLYEGIPLTRRGNYYAGVLPDRITLFRKTIERAARGDDERLKEAVRHTVVHEIAHFFGISDERLRELGRY